MAEGGGISLEIATILSVGGDLAEGLTAISEAFARLNEQSISLTESIDRIIAPVAGIGKAFGESAAGVGVLDKAILDLPEVARTAGAGITSALNASFAEVAAGGVTTLSTAIKELQVPMEGVAAFSTTTTTAIGNEWERAATKIKAAAESAAQTTRAVSATPFAAAAAGGSGGGLPPEERPNEPGTPPRRPGSRAVETAGVAASARHLDIGLGDLAAYFTVEHALKSSSEQIDSIRTILSNTKNADAIRPNGSFDPEFENIIRTGIHNAAKGTIASDTQTGKYAESFARMFREDHAGESGRQVLDEVMKAMPEAIKAAEVGSRIFGDSIADEMKAFVGVSHLLNEWSPAGMHKIYDQVFKAAEGANLKTPEFQTQLERSGILTAKAAIGGGSETNERIIGDVAFLAGPLKAQAAASYQAYWTHLLEGESRFHAARGRAASPDLHKMMSRSLPKIRDQEDADAAYREMQRAGLGEGVAGKQNPLVQLGLLDESGKYYPQFKDAQGHYNEDNINKKLAEDMKAIPNAISLIIAAFGPQGARAATLYADPDYQKNRAAFTDTMNAKKGVDFEQESLIQTPEGQWYVLQKNLSDITANMANTILPNLNDQLKRFNDFLSNVNEFSRNFPTTTGYLTQFIEGALAAAVLNKVGAWTGIKSLFTGPKMPKGAANFEEGLELGFNHGAIPPTKPTGPDFTVDAAGNVRPGSVPPVEPELPSGAIPKPKMPSGAVEPDVSFGATEGIAGRLGSLSRVAGRSVAALSLIFAGLDLAQTETDREAGKLTNKQAIKQSGSIVGGVAGGFGGGTLGWTGGAAAGAALGSVVPGIGTGVGAIIGGVLGMLAGGYGGSKAGSTIGGAAAGAISGSDNQSKPELATLPLDNSAAQLMRAADALIDAANALHPGLNARHASESNQSNTAVPQSQMPAGAPATPIGPAGPRATPTITPAPSPAIPQPANSPSEALPIIGQNDSISLKGLPQLASTDPNFNPGALPPAQEIQSVDDAARQAANDIAAEGKEQFGPPSPSPAIPIGPRQIGSQLPVAPPSDTPYDHTQGGKYGVLPSEHGGPPIVTTRPEFRFAPAIQNAMDDTANHALENSAIDKALGPKPHDPIADAFFNKDPITEIAKHGNFSGIDGPKFYNGYTGHRHYGPGEGVPTQAGFHHYPNNTRTPLSVSPGSVHGSMSSTSSSMVAGKPLANWQIDDAKKLMAMGMSAQDAAGAIGNISAESGGNSGITGDNGKAFGLGQWHPDRQALFKQMYGKDIKDATHDEQLKFYHDELVARKQMPNGATAADSARSIMQQFERPADHATGGANDRMRGSVAESVYKRLTEQAGNPRNQKMVDYDSHTQTGFTPAQWKMMKSSGLVAGSGPDQYAMPNKDGIKGPWTEAASVPRSKTIHTDLPVRNNIAGPWATKDPGLSIMPSPDRMTDTKSDDFARYGYAYPNNTPQINNSHEHHHYIDGEEMTGSIVESLVRNTNTATRGISGFDPLQSSTQPGSVIARG